MIEIDATELPIDMVSQYNQYLQLKEQDLQNVSHDLLMQWSKHLNIFLTESVVEIYKILCNLRDAYRTNNLRYCLNTINKFQSFSGYPFIHNMNFISHINYVCDHLGKTRDRPIPRVPLIAFHKTASSFISVALCNLLNIHPTVISFQHLEGMPAWVNALSKWGGITHDHYYPSLNNLKLLNDAGIERCIIHDRHPLDVLISLAHHWADLNLDRANEEQNQNKYRELVHYFLDSKMEEYIRHHGRWRRGWRQVAAAGQIEILDTHYDDMKKDKYSFFAMILNFYGIRHEEMDLVSVLCKLDTKNSSGNYNFRKGTSSEWMENVTKSQFERVRKLIDEEFEDVSI